MRLRFSRLIPVATRCNLLAEGHNTHHYAQGAYQIMSCSAKLRDTPPHKLVEQVLRLRSHAHQDKAPVFLGALPLQELPLFHAVDEFYHAVMPQLHPLRQCLDRRLLTGRQAPQLQHAHILLRFKANGPNCLFGVLQVAPDKKPYLSQRAIFL